MEVVDNVSLSEMLLRRWAHPPPFPSTDMTTSVRKQGEWSCILPCFAVSYDYVLPFLHCGWTFPSLPSPVNLLWLFSGCSASPQCCSLGLSAFMLLHVQMVAVTTSLVHHQKPAQPSSDWLWTEISLHTPQSLQLGCPQPRMCKSEALGFFQSHSMQYIHYMCSTPSTCKNEKFCFGITTCSSCQNF